MNNKSFHFHVLFNNVKVSECSFYTAQFKDNLAYFRSLTGASYSSIASNLNKIGKTRPCGCPFKAYHLIQLNNYKGIH